MTAPAERSDPRRPWPVVSGAKPGTGHVEEFLVHPARFMLRAWRECGELAGFDLAGQHHVLMVAATMRRSS